MGNKEPLSTRTHTAGQTPNGDRSASNQNDCERHTRPRSLACSQTQRVTPSTRYLTVYTKLPSTNPSGNRHQSPRRRPMTTAPPSRSGPKKSPFCVNRSGTSSRNCVANSTTNTLPALSTRCYARTTPTCGVGGESTPTRKNAWRCHRKRHSPECASTGKSTPMQTQSNRLYLTSTSA